MARLAFATALLLIAGVRSAQEGSAASMSANPIRKVVTMLQDVQKKVEAEGEREKELFDKFMCYCKSSGGDLDASITASEKKIPELQNDIKSSESMLAQLKLDLTQAKADREAAKAATAEATALREKESASFASEKSELETNLAAMKKAVAALEKGAGGAFLQTQTADVVRNIARDADMLDSDRDSVMSFLSGGNDYAPQSGQITGILKQMSDTMAATLEETLKGEETAVVSYQELMAAKTKEIGALTTAIEDKSVRQGEVAVSIVEMKGDLKDTEEALASDKKFVADLEKNCATKKGEWDEICKMRAEEQLALADTIKILNDDDALELFKKTIPAPGASLLQVQVTSAMVKMNALSVLREARSHPGAHKAQLDAIMLAITSKSRTQGFDFIVKKITNMIALIKKEQTHDDEKKVKCEKLLKELADEKADLERSIEDQEKANAEAEDFLETAKTEIKALTDGINHLDKSVAEATEQRKEENTDYTGLIAQDSAAKEILEFAKNRLNKFYNPTQYKAPPKVEMEGAMFAQVSAHSDDEGAPPPPPETFGAYTKKSDESSGVIGMIDTMIADLTKEMTEAKITEKNAQADYEQDMKDSAEKRAADSKSIAQKEKAKAETEEELQKGKELKMSQFKRLMATDKTLTETKGDCEWLLENYEKRAEAREAEQASLRKDIEVLSGSEE